MQENKYFKTSNFIGINEVDVDLLVKDWDKKGILFISVWDNDFTLVKHKSKKVREFKTIISESQANELIQRLDLVCVKSTLFKKAKTYYSQKHVKKEIKRLRNKKLDISNQLKTINSILDEFERAFYLEE